MREVSAAEFTKNLRQYREIAQSEPVAVTSDGLATGYFAIEFEELLRLRASARRTRAMADLSLEDVEQMTSGKMASEHDHLDALLDQM